MSASGFCIHDGFNIEQCLQVWCPWQRLDLLHCHVLLAPSATLIFLVPQWQIQVMMCNVLASYAGIPLPSDTIKELVCFDTKDYTFCFQHRMSTA